MLETQGTQGSEEQAQEALEPELGPEEGHHPDFAQEQLIEAEVISTIFLSSVEGLPEQEFDAWSPEYI